mmetsp:Transcript_66158/g.149354  ORF Transcript_66158/g.149354 Transcript_66158/m.149354 type:complete len:317 (+) Transcript_66158:75-1025(+)|eukprot:CAMPEP_0172584330 /NCGR_PEP_ID=MMETSP1068-20121228/3914_1 /TAXON_ID=35684 /ORGANISM="Pseudopedinella elastica, Strain CCMP716" /LENGTH=316 /DNA_ID=CAMNT_0013378467 /DNA_START=31 /DNA_END=981 /DNA_ORIENTATION=+
MQRARTDSPPREVDSELEKGNFIAKDDYEYHPAKDDYEYAKGKSPLMRETAGRYGLSAVGAMAVLLFFSLRQVPAAHIGLVVMFGSVRESVLLSGLHVVNPVASVIQFNTKTQLLYSENIVPTQEGMNVELDVSLLYHADPSMIRDLYLSIGEEYKNVLILPELQSAVRGLTSEVSAKALYTSGRTEIRQKLVAELTTKLAPRGVILEDVLLKGIKLPVILTDAIEAKAKAEQESQRMEFVLSKEKQEAERKKIEAEGVQSFQKIVSEGISPELLQWKGIEATERLAESPNAKIVMMGNSASSLPVLLSADSDKKS